MKHAIQWTMVLAVAVLVGCLPFGLGDPEQSKVDGKLIGFWLSEAKEGQSDRALYQVLQYDARTYLISGYNFKQEGETITTDGEVIQCKSWLTEVKEQQFLTMLVMSPDMILAPQEEKTYLVSRLEFGEGVLTVSPLKPDALKSAGIDSSEKLAKFLPDHVQDAEVFLEPEKFTKLTNDQAKTLLEKLMQK